MKSWIAKIVVTIALIVFAFVVWSLCFLHVSDPQRTVSPAEVKWSTDCPVPASATNIRMATYQHWVQFEQFVRFEAPLQDCLNAVAAAAPGQTLRAIDQQDLLGIEPMEKGIFVNFDQWFDIAQATNVVGVRGGPSTPFIWIDQTRGVFYFRKTD